MVFLEIAGIKIAFEFAEPGFKALAARRYSNFTSHGKPRYVFSVTGMRGSRTPFKPVVSNLSGSASNSRHSQLRIRQIIANKTNVEKNSRHSLSLRRGDFDCVLNLKTGLGVLKAAPRVQTFDSFLRTFCSRVLLREGGMLLHSAGIVKNGKAYIFLGKSGAGKSTLAKLAASVLHPFRLRQTARRMRQDVWRKTTGGQASFIPHPSPMAAQPPSCSVISDEINLLRFDKGRFRVYGSPFWGEMRNEGRPGSWPLGGVFLLKKAKANRISPCSKPEALKLLLRCLVNFSRGPEDAGVIMENSARLLAGAGFLKLEFTKKNSGFLNLDW
ncbi:MAG: hypothetical protein KKH28_15245 [Elusimicrobia bacterium]|nr:hypothetical protein [Elusimicrobiota bacterium]